MLSGGPVLIILIVDMFSLLLCMLGSGSLGSGSGSVSADALKFKESRPLFVLLSMINFIFDLKYNKQKVLFKFFFISN